MAGAASKDRVRADIEPTDFKGGLEIIRNRIVAKKGKVGEINGEISGLWDQVEKKGIHKKGARIFLTLDGLEESERRDALRTINKLAEAAGWNTSGDLVDEAEGGGADILEMPSLGRGAPGEGDEVENKVDVDAKLEPAGFKSAIVDIISDASDLSEADAYVIANRIYDDLTTKEKSKLTRRLAGEKAEAEMADWPEDDETKQ